MSDRFIAAVAWGTAAVLGSIVVGGVAWLCDMVGAVLAVAGAFGGGVL